MRLPRDISGVSLARALRGFGYEVSRQTGSHIRLTTTENGEHHVTIPAHDPIKIGTLSGILADIATHHGITRETLLSRTGL
ncbi:MAG: type II toxin-antitoxin system HicA family toxin [Acidobacteria bacterium]|nr:type II toxin-antitoxin system HicA family toxin [Acidobacteriota bacterium]